MIELNRIYNEDCIGEHGMSLIPDKSVDMILCDLPYGTTECAWDSIIPFEPLWEQYERVIKDDGAIVLTSAQPFTTMLISSNMRLFKYCWVWEKTMAVGFINAKNRPLSAHEDICVFSKGTIANKSDRRMKYNPQGLVFAPRTKKRDRPMSAKGNGFMKPRPSHKPVYDVEYENYPRSVIKVANSNHDSVHPTQKPVALFDYLIQTYTSEGDTVLDNCMGSGTTAVACIATKRNFIGFELDKEYHRIANERIGAVQLSLIV